MEDRVGRQGARSGPASWLLSATRGTWRGHSAELKISWKQSDPLDPSPWRASGFLPAHLRRTLRLDRMVCREAESPSPHGQLQRVSPAELCVRQEHLGPPDGKCSRQTGRVTGPLPAQQAATASRRQESTCCRESEAPRCRGNTHCV